MLGIIRKFSSSLFAKIFLFIVAIPFIFWGMGPVFQGGKLNTIAEIGNEKISTDEFVNYLKYESQNLEGNILDKNSVERLLYDFIGQKLIALEIEELGIKLSENSLSDLIKNEKTFKKDDKFSRTKYEKFLVINQINAVSFESNLTKQVKKDLLFNFIGGGVVPSNFLVNMNYNKVNQKREVEVINLNDIFKKKINFSEKEIEIYFNKNKNSYNETYKSIKFFKLNPKNLTGADEFNDLYFEKIDEIDDLIVQGKSLDFIINRFNFVTSDTATFDKDGKNKSEENITNFPNELVKKVFNMSEAEPVALIELSNSYYIFELFKTENIQKKIDNKLVRQKILLILERKAKRNFISEIIGKINNNEFKKNDFYDLSKKENALIKKVKIKSQNDDKFLKKELISQIYKYPKNRVIVVADIGLTQSFLVYIDKIEDSSIDKSAETYNKYLNLSKSKIKNNIYSTFDSYLAEKYKVNINHKALETVQNYIE